MTNEAFVRILALIDAMLSIHDLIDTEIVKADSDWLYNRADQLHREIHALGAAAKSVMDDKKAKENKP